ncbi:MAG: RdgB/HAM1 family non-canonical purine NTP pyrophosphatase [Candidatus Micrarchaeota archaeon]
MEIFFATGNEHKFRETVKFFAKNAPSVQLKHFPFKHNEIRSDELAEIADEAVAVAYAQLKKPVFVEDTGLFIDALNGFPGTYSAWAQSKIGNKGLLKLLEGEAVRSARFETVISFTDGKTTAHFRGICPGSIVEKPRGKSGFGFDPIFVPTGHPTTFAENIELKSQLSHRYKSVLLLTNYLKSYTNVKVN